MAIDIQKVRNRTQAAHAETLAWEFVAWLRGRYPEMCQEIDNYLERQNFAETIRDVRPHYGPPGGECLLAMMGERPVGLLMMRDLGNRRCEMNRMYVRDSARGQGVGRALISELVQSARDAGHHTMVLSALPRHHEALALYRNVGFRESKGRELADNDPSAINMSLDLRSGGHLAT